ncbi:MAG: hypothetical protein H6722_25625 [Sandaracinus sp.]|nr:hypothetical protein [Myxococcales bacterium]MCB9615828.1 hypothetical protein [Sandaracinus sp.]MCB9621491.1 hypothetical protein [Sandaracinus sp.]
MKRRVLLTTFLLVLFPLACSSGTGGRLVSIQMRFSGDPSATRFTTSLGYEVTLEEAELVLGPVYAFAPADELVTRRWWRSVAYAHGGLDPLDGRKVRAELLERVVVDALSDEALVFDAAAEEGAIDELRLGLESEDALLDGHVAHVVGTAVKDGVTSAFDAWIDVGASDTERRALVPFVGELHEASVLNVRVDARVWLDGVAFDRLVDCTTPCEFPTESQPALAAALGVRNAHAYQPSIESGIE